MKTMKGKLLKGLAASAALVLSSLSVQGTAAAETGMKDSGISYRETVETIQNPAAGYTSTVWAYCSSLHGVRLLKTAAGTDAWWE